MRTNAIIEKWVGGETAYGIAVSLGSVRSAGDVLRWGSTKMSFFLISHDVAVLSKSMTDLARSVRKTAQP